MKKILFSLFVLFLGLNFSATAQSEDPEKVFKLSTKEETLKEYLKEHDWKDMGKKPDAEDGEFMLFRKKSFGGGWTYLAVHPDKYVHYQRFDDEKREYSKVLNYEDFLHMPVGKFDDHYAIHNKTSNIKNISLPDPKKERNENKFYGKVVLAEESAPASE